MATEREVLYARIENIEGAIHATTGAPKKARYVMRDDERARLISIYIELRNQFPSLTTYKLAKRVKLASGTPASWSTIWHLLIDYGAPRDGKKPCPSAMRNGANHP